MVECLCTTQVNVKASAQYLKIRGLRQLEIPIYLVANNDFNSFSFKASQLDDIIASVAPVSGSPLLEFNNMPDNPISVIDFHGTDDPIIPYDLNR